MFNLLSRNRTAHNELIKLFKTYLVEIKCGREICLYMFMTLCVYTVYIIDEFMNKMKVIAPYVSS